MNFSLKSILPHIGAVAIFIAIAVFYFMPQFQGKVITGNDTTQFEWSVQETRDFKKRTGERTNWTNSMFAGMPNYQISAVGSGNNLRYAEKGLTLGIKRPTGRFLLAMLSFYILMQLLGANIWVSIIGAFAFAFTANNLILYVTGHITKIRVISILPIATAGLILAYKRKYLLGGLLFALGMGLAVYYNHPQMVYYFALTLLIFGIAQAIKDIKAKNYPQFIKASSALLIGGLLALLAAAGNLWVTYDYSKDTIRGETILSTPSPNSDDSQKKNEGGGLDWEYAMAWSNNTLDCFASMIPGLVGGGTQEMVGKNSATYKFLKRKGYRLPPEEIGAPLYWGALPFTAGPIYFGITICFLFFMGLTLVEGPVKWWLVFGTLLTFFLSMGKNLAFINEFFFNYVPLYNKFRTPNSVLSVTAFLVPLLGILALDKIVKGEVDKKQILKSLYIAGGITGGVALFFALIGPSVFDFTSAKDGQYEQFDVASIIADRKSLMRSDSFRALILVLGSAGLVWAYAHGKIKQVILIAGIGILTFYDIWTIDKRYLNDSNYSLLAKQKSQFRPTAADEVILKDQSLDYRVLDLYENTYNSAKASYFHKSLGGYSAVKLRRYQDIMERHLANGNRKVINMLNTRWFIMKGPNDQPQAQQNPDALGNTWFVEKIRIVETADEEIDALNDFSPVSEAIVHQEFSNYVNGLTPNVSGEIKLVEYEPNHLVYQSNTASEQFAVFSEVWYGPNKGWQAYIDGEAVEHIRANYILRAMKVPAGQHKVEFKFEPKLFDTGVLVSQISSLLILLGMLAYIAFWFKNKRKIS